MYTVLREPTKKHSGKMLKSEVDRKKQKMNDETEFKVKIPGDHGNESEITEEAGVESKMAEEPANGQVVIEVPAPESGRGPTLVAFYTINNSNMIIPLGYDWYHETDPLAFPSMLLDNRADFKKSAVEKLLQHFGVPVDGVEVRN